MKLFNTKAYRRGLAMTEYLILLAIVAIAAIVLISMFGKSVKTGFSRSIQALNGQTVQAADTTSATGAVTESGAKDNFSNFSDKSLNP